MDQFTTTDMTMKNQLLTMTNSNFYHLHPTAKLKDQFLC